MAKQAGPFFITGTIGDVTFYKMGGSYYMRMKSEPTNKRKQKQGGTALQQLKKKQFGEASVLVSDIYRKLPRVKRWHLLHQELTGRALHMLREGMSAEAITKLLMDELLPEVKVVAPQEVPKKKPKTSVLNVAKQSGLSGWQVMAGGRLQRKAVMPATSEAVMALAEKTCAPCRFTGLQSGNGSLGSG